MTHSCPAIVLLAGHIMSTQLMCVKTCKQTNITVNSCLLGAFPPISLKEVQSPAQTALLWSACVLPPGPAASLLPGLSCRVKGPSELQAS